MYNLYMGLWWFCFIQWPLFMLYGWASNKHLFSCINFFCEQLETYFVLYTLGFAPFMPLPIILTIIMGLRRKSGKFVSKLEKGLAIGSWILSLLMSIVVFSKGGFS
jgi:hypothetical protein